MTVKMRKVFLFLLLLFLVGCNDDGGPTDPVSSSSSSDSVSSSSSSEASGKRYWRPEGSPKTYNFVVVLTDDQRWDTLWSMPIVQDKLIDRGITFDNAYASSPVCSPTRASFLAGGFYAQNTGVLHNHMPNGGAQKFLDSDSLATLLQEAGYKTALIGKYLNDYHVMAPYVPPGWTKFLAVASGIEYYDYLMTRGSSTEESAAGEIIGPIHEYITDHERDAAIEFLEETVDQPFFLVFSTNAPHDPATPAPEDQDLFLDYLYRDRAYGEEDLTDKPSFMLWYADRFFTRERIVHFDAFMKDQLRSLQAVDRAVGAIVDKIERQGRLNDTVFLFTSDNGFMWGEHRRWDKMLPYEESLRVPFVMVIPGVTPGTDQHLVVPCLDIPATIFDLTGIQAPSDGLSLIPLLRGPNPPWREDFLIEHFLSGAGYLYAGLRTRKDGQELKYIEYSTGDKELYDLVSDPYEGENKAGDPFYQPLMDELARQLEPLKGLAILDHKAPAGKRGQSYAFPIRAWGGEKPYTWHIASGKLPEGLIFDEQSGAISGIPTQEGTSSVAIQITDSSTARHTGEHQSFTQNYVFEIRPSKSASHQRVKLKTRNHLPKAEAGADQSVYQGQPVTLDGRASSDPEGMPLTYHWTQVQGPHVILSEKTSICPFFTAPPVGLRSETLTFRLAVTDSGGLTDTATTRITVHKEHQHAPDQGRNP
jgi:N-acetylglucosamine-6-sulfatase